VPIVVRDIIFSFSFNDVAFIDEKCLQKYSVWQRIRSL